MQTALVRPFLFLGVFRARALPAIAALAFAGALAGCSTSSSYSSAPQASGTLAAQDSFAQRGALSMSAGDTLGMAVYARSVELAHRPSSANSGLASADGE